MTNNNQGPQRAVLAKIARRVMVERGLAPEFSKEALAQLEGIHGPATKGEAPTQDLRKLLWCSIDNDDSRDLDQLTVAEALAGGAVKILVAIADVDAIVKKDSPLDKHAQQNTTSVYTAGGIFPMLPEKLSTDLTSLNFAADRLAMVVEIVFAADGSIQSSNIYQAQVHNQAKLAYNSVAAWLDNKGPIPKAISAVTGLDENIRLQDRMAQKLKDIRHAHGALEFNTIQTHAVFDGDAIKDLQADEVNRAKELIAEFMVAANGVGARYLAAKKFPSIRRVVREPKRWDRIVALAAEHNVTLPATPDSQALEQFLVKARAADPVGFPDLSLCVIKLMGAGEYIMLQPEEAATGHFGLAVKDYAHSTAPNRRFPDDITQRLIKAATSGKPVPYKADELSALAKHCTQQEDAAKKVERQVAKSAAAMLLHTQVGKQFDGIVTGASDKGTWVRIFHPPIEGKLLSGTHGVDVHDKIRVQLVSTDVERGFIDFKRVG